MTGSTRLYVCYQRRILGWAGLIPVLESYIAKAEEASGVKFHEAQIALAKLWVGDTPTGTSTKQFEQKTAAIKVPQPSAEGVTQGKDSQSIEEVKLPANDEEARRTIEKFERGAMRFFTGPWFGPVLEILYSHRKKAGDAYTQLTNKNWFSTFQ